jgi:putative ABC transport system permease protein
MKITSLLSQSVVSIWGNKVRTGLTVLGIVIGIAAVIALVGLGKGLQANVSSRISGLGTTKLTVRSQDPSRPTAQRQGGGEMRGPGGGGQRGGFSFGGGNTATLTEADYTTVKQDGSIAKASPEMTTQVDVTKTQDATEATAYQLYGIDTDYLGIQQETIAGGANLTASQVSNGDKAVVIGEQAAKDLFGSTDNVIGQKLYIKDTEFTVVGLLKQPDNGSNFNRPSDNLYTGYRAWQTTIGTTTYSSIVAEAKNEGSVDSAATDIKTKLLAAHKISDGSKPDFNVSTNKDLLNAATNVAGSFTSTLAGIAAISLVVGGIGIMNIMLVTVTERTREIGLRRAVGAKTKHIMLQFLSESVILTLAGGVIGLLVGILLSSHIGSLLGAIPGQRGGGAGGASTVKAVVDGGTVALAIGISILIGVVFGLFPAYKAARLDPVEALRYE